MYEHVVLDLWSIASVFARVDWDKLEDMAVAGADREKRGTIVDSIKRPVDVTDTDMKQRVDLQGTEVIPSAITPPTMAGRLGSDPLIGYDKPFELYDKIAALKHCRTLSIYIHYVDPRIADTNDTDELFNGVSSHSSCLIHRPFAHTLFAGIESVRVVPFNGTVTGNIPFCGRQYGDCQFIKGVEGHTQKMVYLNTKHDAPNPHCLYDQPENIRELVYHLPLSSVLEDDKRWVLAMVLMECFPKAQSVTVVFHPDVPTLFEDDANLGENDEDEVNNHDPVVVADTPVSREWFAELLSVPTMVTRAYRFYGLEQFDIYPDLEWEQYSKTGHRPSAEKVDAWRAADIQTFANCGRGRYQFGTYKEYLEWRPEDEHPLLMADPGDEVIKIEFLGYGAV